MKKILFVAAAAATFCFAACTGNKTANTSEPDSLCCKAGACTEKCECADCKCPEGACAEGKCENCNCNQSCCEAKAECPAASADADIATLTSLIDKADAEGIKNLANQVAEKVAAFLAKGDEQAAQNYSALISNFVAENIDKLQSLGVASAFSDALSKVEGLPAGVLDIATSAAQGVKSDALSAIISAVTTAKDAATQAGDAATDAAAEAVDAAKEKADEAVDAAKQGAADAIDNAAAAAKDKLGL